MQAKTRPCGDEPHFCIGLNRASLAIRLQHTRRFVASYFFDKNRVFAANGGVSRFFEAAWAGLFSFLIVHGEKEGAAVPPDPQQHMPALGLLA